MPTAFVLSGGGSLGAVQVGMLRALADHDLRPDLLVGASAGALNAAFVAGRGVTPAALDELAGIWCSLRRQDVFPFAPHRQLLALAGARPSLCAPDGLRRLITRHVGYDRLEDAAVPVHVVTTDVLSGTEVVLSRGDPVTAVMASAAIPGVFPTVTVDGRALFDGGVADNTPIRTLIERAETATNRWLAAGNHRLPHPERFLSLHRHPHVPAPAAAGECLARAIPAASPG